VYITHIYSAKTRHQPFADIFMEYQTDNFNILAMHA